jgi:5-methylcytosine-specific restriction endonuclease McrA
VIDLKELGERDNWHCHICGGHVRPELMGKERNGAPTRDHIIPQARGGANTPDNLRLAHRVCNQRRGMKNAKRYGQKFRRKQEHIKELLRREEIRRLLFNKMRGDE